MTGGGDKLVTNVGNGSAIRSKSTSCKRRKKRDPALVVKSGSASVPVYRLDSGGRVRFAIVWYEAWFGPPPREGKWDNTFAFDRRTRTVKLPGRVSDLGRPIRAPAVPHGRGMVS
jgi:hypothetical protein